MSKKIQTYKLGTNITLFCIPEKLEGLYLSGLVKVGSANDPREIPGLAHFIEHLQVAAATKQRTYSSAANNLRAWTDKEWTIYTTQIVGDDWEKGLKLIAKCMANTKLSVHPGDISLLKQESETQSKRLSIQFWRTWNELVFPDWERAHSTIGTVERIAELNNAYISNFIHTNYCIAEKVFILYGDIPTWQQLQKALQAVSDPSTAANITATNSSSTPLEAFYQPSQTRIIRTKQSNQQYMYGFVLAETSYHNMLVSELLIRYLAHGWQSKLIDQIIINDGHSYYIKGTVKWLTQNGYFVIGFSSPNEKVDSVLNYMDELFFQMEKNCDHLFMTQAKKQFKNELLLESDNPTDLIQFWNRLIMAGLPLVDIHTLISDIDRITETDIIHFAKNNFIQKNFRLILSRT